MDKCTSSKDEDELSNTISGKTDVSKMEFIPTEKNTAEKKSGTVELMDVNKNKLTDGPAIEERKETSTDISRSETLQTKAREKKTSANSPVRKRGSKRNARSDATSPGITTRS